jgi:DNA repair protein RecO (recombination protein O)
MSTPSTSWRARRTDFRAIDYERILRRFEKNLLSEIGYGATFDIDADSGAPIEAGPALRLPARTRRAAGERAAWLPGLGQTLIDLAAGRFERQPTTLAEAKVLMRTLINHTLGAKPLYTRQLLRELTELNPPNPIYPS